MKWTYIHHKRMRLVSKESMGNIVWMSLAQTQLIHQVIQVHHLGISSIWNLCPYWELASTNHGTSSFHVVGTGVPGFCWKCLPILYSLGQSSVHLMASTFIYLDIWLSLCCKVFFSISSRWLSLAHDGISDFWGIVLWLLHVLLKPFRAYLAELSELILCFCQTIF